MSSSAIISFMYQHCKHYFISSNPAMPPSPSPSQIFPLFSQLPTEIRLKIWEEVAAQPHTVELTCTPTSSYLPGGRWISHSKPAPIFNVCAESRYIAYAKYASLVISPEQLGVPLKTPLYFNFEADTLWLCADLSVPLARDLLEKNEQLKENLRFLAVSKRTWKVINQVELTPSWRGYTDTLDTLPLPVRCGLKKLDGLQFHSWQSMFPRLSCALDEMIAQLISYWLDLVE